MPKIGDLLAEGPTFSFEFGPPRDEEGERRLEKTLIDLEPLQPSFVSVTYGAGGSTREKTRQIVEHIHRDTSMTPMPHLTCVAQTRAAVRAIVEGYRDVGLENLLALAGDPPVDQPDAPSDFRFATELIELAREVGDFSIGVAAFPEGHPRSASVAADRSFLAAKLRLVEFGITQFFFDAADYFRMVDDLAALGVDTPVLPGVMAFVNVDGLRRMAAMNGAAIPPAMEERLDRATGQPGEVRRLAVEVTTALCSTLLEQGVPGLHFYTMNYSRATREIWANLSLGPRSAAE